uniref:Amidohydrolase-related domain-containing protein n=1 Tax=Tetradesmus obliquus TaxID=3088 RepID=A0A383V5S3_TETOB|eukprot:jgi/Sobl393_1/17902/SZX60958.1
MAGRLIDSHVHVWAPVERKEEFPFYGQMLGASSNDPPMPGHAEVLLAAMEEAGVSGALIVQPSNHQFDHSYLNSVLEQYPDKFVGCLLADPTPGGGGAAAIEQLATEHGYRAVRFNPYLWPEGEKMTNEVGQAMYKKAGELGLPVGHMPFKGLLLHIDEIEQLLQQNPATKAIIDHMGFCKCDNLQSEEWQRLLGLAKYPQVYVKASAFFRVSAQQQYPYADTCAGLKALVDAFGAQRVMWGSDFPWITSVEGFGYVKGWQLLDDVEAATGEQLLTQEQRQWVFGGTIAGLFPGSWQQRSS